MDDKPLRSKTPDEPNHWPIQLLRGRLSSRTKKSGSNKQANRKKKQADRILTPFDLQALRSTRRSRSASTPTNHYSTRIGSIHHPLPAPASQTQANRTGRASGSAPPISPPPERWIGRAASTHWRRAREQQIEAEEWIDPMTPARPITRGNGTGDRARRQGDGEEEAGA